ncbi:MAG: aminotransferase class I/II-fold pyridoxal phosphate-dependent enzyme [Elusimicrobia bacterium]|nr:aminotransferase class I/II-fold pyridoxal phosphate-dependent enzyme [Elusimicrobiota bacterium]
MLDIFQKCRDFQTAKSLIERGIYPYFKEIESAQGPEVMLNGRKFIMIGSNNYLGLADDPRMKAAASEAALKYGTGCAGSRFLNGNTVFHKELEKKIARFKHKEAALVYATGYQMNLGVVSCLVGRDDVAIVDKLDHASILDGIRLSSGEMKRYRHNDMNDLDRVLSGIGPEKGKLVIVDGVFSMEGDICNLPEIVKIAKKHGARVMVDDAHGSGVLGKNGRGTCEHFNLHDEVDLIVGTCSKSFAAVGGFVAGSADVIHYIQNTSRSMIFSAAMPLSCVATISKAIDIIEAEPERRANLWRLTNKLKQGLQDMGYDTGNSQTPIIPVVIGEDVACFSMWKMLSEAGLFATPVITPAVPPGQALIRVTLMATHTDAHVDRVLEVFEQCGTKLGVIKAGRKNHTPAVH